jgi:hypothetical protein
MRKAKVRTLSVRPFKSTDLAFPNPGILVRQGERARLGRGVDGQDRSETVARLLAAASPGELQGRIDADSRTLIAALQGDALFTQSHDRLASDIDQAIANHHSEYLERYSSAASTGANLRRENTERLSKIKELQARLDERHAALSAEYQARQSGVVGSVSSISRHEGDAAPISKTYTAPMQLMTPTYTIKIEGGGIQGTMLHTVAAVEANPRVFKGGTFQAIAEELSVNSTATPAVVAGVLTQVTESTQQPVVTRNDLPELEQPALNEHIEFITLQANLDAV